MGQATKNQKRNYRERNCYGILSVKRIDYTIIMANAPFLTTCINNFPLFYQRKAGYGANYRKGKV